MKKCPCNPAAIGEICYGFGKKEIAKNAFLKVAEVDQRIELLIEYEMWEDAVKQVYANKRQEDYVDELMKKGGHLVGRYIKMQEDSLAVGK